MLLSLRLRWKTRSLNPTLTISRRFGWVTVNERTGPALYLPSVSSRCSSSVRSDRCIM